MKVGIVNCGGANLNSIYYSLSRIGVKSIISASQKDLDATDYLILPGVGSATVVMDHLKAVSYTHLTLPTSAIV